MKDEQLYWYQVLKTIRFRGDLIQYFKLVRRIKLISWHRNNASVPSFNLRGASHRFRSKLVKNCSQRDNFFLNRIVPNWNDLPELVIQSLSVNQLKIRIHKHIKANGLKAGTILLSGLPF